MELEEERVFGGAMVTEGESFAVLGAVHVDVAALLGGGRPRPGFAMEVAIAVILILQ